MRSELEEIVPQETLDSVFYGTCFGDDTPRQIVADTLLKLAGGFSTGYTAITCCRTLGLVGKQTYNLTKKGKRYLFYCFYQHTCYAPEPSGDMVWKPIETAPKSGARIILLIPILERDPVIFMGSYNGCGWVSDRACFHAESPTHWMPLPKPPVTEKSE